MAGDSEIGVHFLPLWDTMGYEPLLSGTIVKITRVLLAIQADECVAQTAYWSPFLPGLKANKEAVM